MTFDQAVARALEHNPTVGEAAQAILRAQALLEQARAAFRPTLYAGGHGASSTPPAASTATSPSRGRSRPSTPRCRPRARRRELGREEPGRRPGPIASISAEERAQVALTAAQAYLAVIAAQRQREIALRNLDTARALDEYARARLEAGKGSRLNHVRSTQERARPRYGSSRPSCWCARPRRRWASPSSPTARSTRGDPVLQPARHRRRRVAAAAAGRAAVHGPAVGRRPRRARFLDDLGPDRERLFTPQYVNPKGGFEPARTWRAIFQLQIPIYDGTLGPAKRVQSPTARPPASASTPSSWRRAPSCGSPRTP